MASNDYHFITTWCVPATLEEVVEIISDAADLVRWWPSVYLNARVIAPGDARGVGKVVDLYTKGWLPYTLRWQFRVTEAHDRGFTLVAEGDFVGRGIWTFEPDGDYVNIIYDWKIRADKPLLRTFSFAMKPIFSANHHWAMARGEESLKLELARRRARTPAERSLIPAPPAATKMLPFVLGSAAVWGVALLAVIAFRRR